MKKIVSLMLVMAVLMSVCMMSASAGSSLKGRSIEDRFVEEFGEPVFYEEVAVHYVDSDRTKFDWVLIYAATSIAVEPTENPIPTRYVVCDIIYSTIYFNEPFKVPYCVYDAQKDEFIDICDVDFSQYEGLCEAFCTSDNGRLIGDIDKDGVLSVIDATEIQRVEAQLSIFEDVLVADFNRDKSMDIMDATAIQMKLAGFDAVTEINYDMVYATHNNDYQVDTGIKDVEYGVLYNGYQDFGSHNMPSDHFAVIVKSKEQYDAVFNFDNDVYDDEFFRDKWIVATVNTVYDAQETYRITYLGTRNNVNGATLFMRANRVLNDTDGVSEPIAPPYFSFVSVDKWEIANVNEIVWM